MGACEMTTDGACVQHERIRDDVGLGFGQGFGEYLQIVSWDNVMSGWGAPVKACVVLGVVGVCVCVCVARAPEMHWTPSIMHQSDDPLARQVGQPSSPDFNPKCLRRRRIIVVAGPAKLGLAWLFRVRRGLGAAHRPKLSSQVLRMLQSADAAVAPGQGGLKLSDRRQACSLLNSFGRSMAC